eukprot:SAG31_NODE_10659_length_1113_cov_1.106509_2_plen_60_part_00
MTAHMNIPHGFSHLNRGATLVPVPVLVPDGTTAVNLTSGTRTKFLKIIDVFTLGYTAAY